MVQVDKTGCFSSLLLLLYKNTSKLSSVEQRKNCILPSLETHEYDNSFLIFSKYQKMNLVKRKERNIELVFLLNIQLIPEYDREPNQRLDERIYHDDVNVTSRLLDDLIVSFRWRPIIDEKIISDIRNWTSSSDGFDQVPDFILIGIITVKL